jgi:hypothetical protein
VSCTGFEADSDTCTNFDPYLGHTLHCQLSISVKTWLGIPSVEPMSNTKWNYPLEKRGKGILFLGRIFHFHLRFSFSVIGWDVTFCAMVSLSMIRAHGPGFTETRDTLLTLTSGPLFW